MTTNEPMYDLSYSLLGRGMVKRWHYPFYGAICSLLDERPGPTVGIFLANSVLSIKDRIHFTPDTSLVIRTPASEIPIFVKLVGTRLEVSGSIVRLGSVRLFPLRPAARLYS